MKVGNLNWFDYGQSAMHKHRFMLGCHKIYNNMHQSIIVYYLRILRATEKSPSCLEPPAMEFNYPSLAALAAEVRSLSKQIERQRQTSEAQGELIVELIEAVAAITIWQSQHQHFPRPAQNTAAETPSYGGSNAGLQERYDLQAPRSHSQMAHIRQNSGVYRNLQNTVEGREERGKRPAWDDSPLQRRPAALKPSTLYVPTQLPRKNASRTLREPILRNADRLEGLRQQRRKNSRRN